MNNHLLRFDKTKKITFFDFETYNTFLNFNYNRFWQIALMTVVGDKIVDTKNLHVKWKNCDLKISKGAAEKTHFNQKTYDVLAVYDDTILDSILKVFDESDYLVAHNGLNFDIFLLKEWAKMYGKPWRHYTKKIIDTNALAKGIKMSQHYKPGEDFTCYQYKMLHQRVKGVRTRLEYLGKEFEIDHDYEGLHDALKDVDLNRKVWDILKFQVEI